MADWSAFARDSSYANNGGVPLISASFVRRHLGVDTAVATVPYSVDNMARLYPPNGVLLYRDGRQEFSGPVTEINPTWDAESGSAVIKVQAVGDAQHLADRLVFPDPLRAADDQTVNDYWTFTGTPSAAMVRLISDQAGPTCQAARRMPGLVLAGDPSVGTPRAWSALFSNLMEQLTLISVASGADLGVRVTSSAGVLTAAVQAARNLADTIKFSADLSNLVGVDYRVAAPKVTHALSAGQGDLHARLRKLAVTDDELALSFNRQVWSYIDRRDTADVTELSQAATDALADGAPTVSLAVTLTDSEAATYGRDWDVGDRVTVYVGLPGQAKVATVSDVVREIKFDVTADGAEKITPAIGSFDAKATIPTPTQQQLARVGRSLAGLIART